MPEFVLVLVVVAATGVAVMLARKLAAAVRDGARLAGERRAFEQRLAPILDVEAEAARVRSTLDADRRAAESDAASARARAAAEIAEARASADATRRALVGEEATSRGKQAELFRSYATARATFDRPQREVALLEENLEDISFGVYRPHHDFGTTEAYKERLEGVWNEQKALIKDGRAVEYGVAWTIGDSRREGERMQKQYGKLLLRASNGECDASIAKVSWNNATKMEARIRKGFEAVNELGGVMKISVTPAYRELRIAELRLHHEREERQRAELEEQRRLREEMRDEERAQRELDRAREEAEEEERRPSRALEKAHAEMMRAKDEEARLALAARVQALKAELEQAHPESERAISQAQLTRSGHVYIISNVGSFGDELVKIGMPRRLDPRDRIKELTDASVPFDFDIHGLVSTQDAPTLERELHLRFGERRVTLVNPRWEFFRVTLDEIGAFLREKQLDLELSLLAEAREYRETLAMRSKADDGQALPLTAQPFPAALFEGSWK